jgi:hypothetical protein
VKEGQFAGVWPSNLAFFIEARSKGALVGIAIDPLTSHECGNQRYLAVPWLDACLTARLSSEAGAPLRAMAESSARLALLPKPGGAPIAPVSAASFSGAREQAIWLPTEAIAKAWMEYVTDTKVSDATPPPSPTNLQVKGQELTWEAEADLESGVAQFIIECDGQPIATVPEQPKNPFGRPVFQGLQYSDTPGQPLIPMSYIDANAEAGKEHRYRVIAVNTVGLKSQ